MADQPALTLLDIPWLRQAAGKAGAHNTPDLIERRLLAGKLVIRDDKSASLRITKRGELALARLT